MKDKSWMRKKYNLMQVKPHPFLTFLDEVLPAGMWFLGFCTSHSFVVSLLNQCSYSKFVEKITCHLYKLPRYLTLFRKALKDTIYFYYIHIIVEIQFNEYNSIIGKLLFFFAGKTSRL